MGPVSFPWYDYPFLQTTYDRYWRTLRAALADEGLANLPGTLARPLNLDAALRDDQLLCSQTCGYDIAVGAPGPLRMICTPSYAAPGCGDGTYRSALVVRADRLTRGPSDLVGFHFVANDERSWSGFHCVREHWPSFSRVTFSGGHRSSLGHLRAGRADVAAIDAIAWDFHLRHDPGALSGLKIIGWTKPAPAPPLVTSRLTPAWARDGFRRALDRVLKAEPELCASLLIRGFVRHEPGDYAFMKPPTRAADAAARP